MILPRMPVWVAAALVCCAMIVPSTSVAEEPQRPMSLAAASTLRNARQLMEQDDVANAVILLESQLAASAGNRDYLDTTLQAYQRQFNKYQSDGKLPQASALWAKMVILRPDLGKQSTSAPAKLSTPSPTITTRQTSPTLPTDPMQAAEAAFAQGKFQQACDCYQHVQSQGAALPDSVKEKYAYCKLRQVAEKLNALQGQPGDLRPQMEREVRAALELAPRLEFGNELLRRLQPVHNPITTAIRHLDQKEQGWQVCESDHFRVFHNNAALGEQVAQIAETTRAAVIRKWLGADYTWQQPCQIFVHPTAESYHKQSGMPATAPGHSDYDADKNDASVIHYRRVFVRADHAHMLNAILPHEVTHVVLNGQFGRKLLPRWADEGMAVLSEPYERIEMHLEPLARSYQDRRALTVQELLNVQDYPADRSKVASFYGQSVCLVEFLTTLKGPREFVAYMRDANSYGDAESLQRHYGLSIADVEAQLQDWIVAKRMPTLMRK